MPVHKVDCFDTHESQFRDGASTRASSLVRSRYTRFTTSVLFYRCEPRITFGAVVVDEWGSRKRWRPTGPYEPCIRSVVPCRKFAELGKPAWRGGMYRHAVTRCNSATRFSQSDGDSVMRRFLPMVTLAGGCFRT
jgi:hypothetical protein